MDNADRPGTLRDTARFWLIVAAIAMAAAIFRFAIARYSLWFDEQASMFFIRQPLARLWSGWMIREPNPPLYYSLLKGWVVLFGQSERGARSLSIAAGALGIVTTAGFTARLYGREAGLIAAVLSALSAQQLYFSLQLRGYALLYLAASGVLIGLLAIDRALVERRASRLGLILYGLGCTACIYLHTTMFLLPVIGTAALIWVHRQDLLRRPMLLIPVMAANAGIAAAAAWWAGMTLRQIATGAENTAVFDAITPGFVVRTVIGTLTLAREPGVARAAIAVLIAGIAAAQIGRDWARRETRLVLIIAGLTIGLFALISLIVPIFLPRTIFWLSLIATALCAARIARIASPIVRWSAAGALSLLVAVNMATGVAGRQTEDWTGAIRRAQAVPGSRLIVQGEAMGLLLNNACERLNHGACPVAIIAITTPDDQLDRWSAGQCSCRLIALDQLDALPSGRYFVFRKAFYHDLLKTLQHHGRATRIAGDPPLLGPVDRSALLH